MLMAVNDIFKKVPIEVPNKSGFDMSHQHLFTAKCGTLVPAMVDMLLPNDTISLGVSSEIQLPPMATDFYGRVKGHFEAFFVPFRVLYAGWQELITHPENGEVWPVGTNSHQKAKYLPTLEIPQNKMLAGSLADYLGYCFEDYSLADSVKINVRNPLKFVAYHKIWDDWYRDSRIQQPAFARSNVSGGSGTQSNINGFSALPYTSYYDNSPIVIGDYQPQDTSLPNNLECCDGVRCYSLRQRNFGKDYFTNASTLPQAGQPAAVAFQTDAQGNGAFTIASLRAANALQTWMERQNVAGYRYGDQIKANFGVYPSDAVLDRSLYLGRQIVDVYNKSVYQNGNEASPSTNNPFSTVASKFGSPLGVGDGSLVENFTATEHGYIFVMFSLVPEAIYADTIDKDFWYNSMANFPFPLLAGVGDEPITFDELVGYSALSDALLQNLHANVFGYTQRYANHKFKLDKVSALLKDGNNLENFALQRRADPLSTVLSSSFLEIPTDYLDQVAAVQGDVSKYGCWVDAFFPYKKISTLPAYSIPTLGDLHNTHTEVVNNGGTRL